ncbi:MAG: hypothetical protein QN123_04225 [Armatimonadota bacterium]|nr:hypothetical protein [Armatimonadota bacterium]
MPTGDRAESGRTSVDLVMGVVLFSLMVVSLYQVFIPTLVLSRNTTERLDRQQDVRLAIDRLARELQETTMTPPRLLTYACSGPYQGCIGYVTARVNCTGQFQMTAEGYPNWQATVYVWRDTASNELRRRCDASTAFPVSAWPPATLTPFTVVARDVAEARFTRLAAGVEVFLRERAPGALRSGRRYQTDFVNQTVFVPQNR